jgi:hypothetical protein
MIPEGSARGLEAIQRPHNEGSLPSVFTKFRAKHSPNFACDWGSQISIINFAHHDIQIIQCCQPASLRAILTDSLDTTLA